MRNPAAQRIKPIRQYNRLLLHKDTWVYAHTLLTDSY